MIREVGPVQFRFVIPTERRNLSPKFVISTEGEICCPSAAPALNADEQVPRRYRSSE
jgi:hypothetical protein